MARRLQETATGALTWDRFRGRCGVDDPATLPPDMGAEAINWVITARGLGQKRYGSSQQPITGTYTRFNALARFLPGMNEAGQELHFLDDATPPKFFRVAAGTAAVNLPLSDAVTGPPQFASAANGNGRLFWAYKSGVNRLHLYDPDSGNVILRAGLPAPGAPTVSNTGSGLYAAVARRYRIQLRTLFPRSAMVSNLGIASASFTPSGTGAAARVTLGTLPSESESHWRVYGSTDGTLYYLLSGWIPIATTFYDDTRAPSAYNTSDAAPLEGSYYPLPSAKYLLWDGTHLLLFGSWGDQTGNDLPAVQGRVYITRALESLTDGGEDTSIAMTQTIKGYVDINRGGAAEDRGIIGPVDGNVFVLQSRGIYLLKPTGAQERVYVRVPLTKELGAVSHWSSFIGEDESGRPAAYWLDPERGPYKYGANGLEWLGYDIQDIWQLFNADATIMPAHGLYDPRTRRCYWWIATGAANEPNLMLCFHVKEGRSTATEGVRYGWTIFHDYLALARCSLIFAETFGTTMSRRVKPYAGFGVAPGYLLRADDATMKTDAGQLFASAITSKAWVTTDLPKILTLDRSWVRAPTTANATIFQQLIRNFGDDDPQITATDLLMLGAETRRIFQFEEAQLAGAFTFQTILGDLEPTNSFYALDRWHARMTFTDLEVGTSAL